MIIIRRLSVLLLIIICCGMIANADNNKSYKCEGNTYIISSTGRVNAYNVKSKFEYKDAKISQDICKKLDKEYKTKKK